MKKLFKKIGSALKTVLQSLAKPFVKLANSKAVKWYIGSSFHKTHRMLWDDYAIIMHIPLSLFMCFLMEWLSRHSFMEAMGFVTRHTGPYLFNSYCIFVAYTLVFISKRQRWWRNLISLFFLILGITNCIILLNRVSPFGYTDLYMVSDLLTMADSQYFTAEQATLVVISLVAVMALMIVLLIKGPKKKKVQPFWKRILVIAAFFASLYPSTRLLRSAGIMTSYFGNLAQGYLDYGYLYGFATSVLDRGMSKPFGYSESKIASIISDDNKYLSSLKAYATYDEEGNVEDTVKVAEITSDDSSQPNIIVMLLESFYDVSECNFLTTSEDPIPFVHYLEDNYSTGYCIVPVVGAGTCNTEFEVLTGMSCSFFGPGEYPQKTILKEIDSCESYADVLKDNGYSSHVVHNNGGNFYSRKNAFSLMGFDTFSSKEMLDITDYTPLGNWPTDDILIDATKDSMDSTKGPDFVYTITVEAHGAYPTYPVEENPAVTVTAEGKSDEVKNAWEYYVNRIYNVDDFLKQYIEMLDSRDEDTLVIMFGDHLPTMGLTDDEVATGDLYKTKYFTWNNFGMKKIDQDLTSYQLVSEYLNRLGYHNGNINGYHQTSMGQGLKYGSLKYMDDLEMLQYDNLYGNKYAYQVGTKYEATDIQMGINDVTIDSAYFFNGKLHIYGDNFTKWSKVYVNGEKVSTSYESGQVLTIKASDVNNGDTITVCQLGSSNTIFRESNQYTINDPHFVPEDEDQLEDESAETESED